MHKNYITQSPILLLVFNRFETTKKVFDAIKLTKPLKIYLSSDGPRPNNINDVNNIKLIREYITSQLDWPCELKTRFLPVNLGCKDAVSSGITWFFENEEEGIILEDDCLPNNSFFRFCDILLEKYRYDNRVRHISGVNFLDNDIEIINSYYFSKFTHVWGWASWSRVWCDYDKDLKSLDKFISNKFIGSIYPNKQVSKFLIDEFYKVKSGLLNTWDYQYLYLNFINNGLTIIPSKTLITNIGFNTDATHDFSEEMTKQIAKDLNEEIVHPDFYIPNLDHDIKSLIKINNLTFVAKLKIKIKKFI
jgi:hypothetical protein